MTQAEVASGRRRVPVEHRLLGLDKRTLPFAVAALAVWLLWVVVVPAVDDAVPWRDETRPGDVFQVTPTVTMTPAVGWGVQSGLRTTDRTASGDTSDNVVLVNGGVAFQITSGPWTGTPAELLDRITVIIGTVSGSEDFRLTRGATTMRTAQGNVGVLESFATPQAEGLIAALVYDGQGLQIQAVGPPEQLDTHAEELGRMISSIGDGSRS
jgi:hypothetical protein